MRLTNGYIQVYTGDGKGKTTAALGLAIRAVGAGLKVYIGQFIKQMEYSEISVLKNLEGITIELYGTNGCIFHRPVNETDMQGVIHGLDRALEILKSGEYDIVILDEFTIPISLGMLSEHQVMEVLLSKLESTELVITGRDAPKYLVDAADLVTDMGEVKHYYATHKVTSRKGIEV